jgi:hypothetical protein
MRSLRGWRNEGISTDAAVIAARCVEMRVAAAANTLNSQGPLANNRFALFSPPPPEP